MKKVIILCLIFCLAYTALAKPYRFKLGFTDYSTGLKELSTKHGIYRLHSRLDILRLSSRLGLGTAANITFKSDNPDVKFNNFYDFYAHNFYGDKSHDGRYMVYGLVAGVRLNKVKTSNEDYFSMVTYTNWSFLLGMLISRNDWGTEIMLSQNQQDKWKFDFATKYQFSGKYYLEVAYCYTGPVKEIDRDFSITFGIEFYSN
ncbi:MAG: hypothetical protein K9M99_10285 [Candidatus Cloacimonetes bacterium]|nr:hypothetical protein [Candidatus Cloacimonadota bacterium]